MPRIERAPLLLVVGLVAWIGLAASVHPAPAGLAPGAEDDDALERAVLSITAAELRASLRFLASDLLEGRGTGHPGNERAALYLATMFERVGLAPVDGTMFRQPLPLVTPVIGEPNELAVIETRGGTETRRRFDLGTDFSPVVASTSGEVTAGLAFVGYGISAPDAGYDDYAGLDVRGRIVVAFMGIPRAGLAGRRLAPGHGHLASKAAAAAERGAVALLLVPTTPGRTVDDGRDRWEAPRSPRSTRFLLEGARLPLPTVTVSGDTAWALIGSRSRTASLDALDAAIDEHVRTLPESPRTPTTSAASFVVPDRRAVVAATITHRRVAAHNVLGMIEGVDASVKDELVVIGAHFDHDGIDDAGRIYNGADDDGSGTAGVIEIAEAFARAAAEGHRPRRTVVFALWNAEEKGMLGSRHYVSHVLPNGGRPVVKLNLDMIGRSEEVPERADHRFSGLAPTRAADNANVVHLLGYSRSPELAAIVEAENRPIGLTVRTEYDFHVQNLLQRSDQWPFVERGIPAAFFTTGLHPDYHTPDDDVERIDFAKMERIVRLVFRTAWRLSRADHPPRFESPSSPTDQ